MSTNLSPLQKRFGDRFPLKELEAFFRALEAGEYKDCDNAGLELFSVQESLEVTDDFKSFHPLFQAEETLQLLMLGTDNQSNYYCYAFDFPCPGAIVHLPHDGTTQIVFPNLGEFIAALRQASQANQFLEKIHQPGVYLSPNQTQLTERMREGYTAGLEEPIWLLLRSSDLSDSSLMIKIAEDRNFYFGEALAERIIAGPTPEMLPIATACAKHSHPQVSNVGKRALAAVQKLKS